ncbi:MAG: aldo/keto reductase [Chitinivibrionales bacterium]|nr:aldo/keto reductase [Chitinivibrionales bacterium]
MQYRTIGTSEIKVSTVAHGTWAAGGRSWGDVEDQASIEAMKASIEAGVTLIDTAPVYGRGHAEELVGQAIKGCRDRVVISTKCGLLIDEGNRRSLTPETMRRECEDSLRRMDTDYIDIYFCHWPDPDTPIEETIGGLTALLESGKIRAIGLSNHGPDLVRRAHAAGPLHCLQEHYSLLQRTVEDETLPLARELNPGVMAYAPLGGGILTGKYTAPPSFDKRDVRDFFYPFYKEPLWSRTQDLLDEMRTLAEAKGVSLAQLAVAWVNARDGVTCSLVGAKNPGQAQANAAAADIVLEPAEVDRLTAASDNALQGM